MRVRSFRERQAAIPVLLLTCCTVLAGCSSAKPADAPSASGTDSICGAAPVAVYETAYDGTQPLCAGFAGDTDHAGEGAAGTETSASISTVTQWALLHARAIYSFQPTTDWLAGHPHSRLVNGYFHRLQKPAAGDGTAMRAYKDFLTPAPGQTGNEKEFALFAVIVSPKAQSNPGHAGGAGGVWFIGCLTFHSDKKEYLDTCPSWVWSVPVVPSTTRRL